MVSLDLCVGFQFTLPTRGLQYLMCNPAWAYPQGKQSRKLQSSEDDRRARAIDNN